MNSSAVVRGLTAGAVGTALLEATTYLDIALRGRPPSSLPEEDVDRVARRLGISLGDDAETAANRRTGLGALMGYVVGLSVGSTYGLVRARAPRVPLPVAVLAVSAGTMAATNAGSVGLGTTSPRSWSAADWASDVIPHAAFGLGVVLTYDALDH